MLAHREMLPHRKIDRWESRHGRICCRLDPVVSDPDRSSPPREQRAMYGPAGNSCQRGILIIGSGLQLIDAELS
jgi:hypothetical protein